MPRRAARSGSTRRRARLRERFAAAAAEERASVAAELRRMGVDHLVLSTAGDWLRTLAGELHVRGIRS